MSSPEGFDAGVLVLVDTQVLPLDEAAATVGAHKLAALVRARVLLVRVQRAEVLPAPFHRAPAARENDRGCVTVVSRRREPPITTEPPPHNMSELITVIPHHIYN